MELVVNASPLILLGKVGRCELLSRLGGSVWVPEGVVAEVEAEPDDPAANALQRFEWLKRAAVVVPDVIKVWDLGRGESEVLAYSREHPGVRPLLDDAEGMACALALGLKPLGTGGLLILAKKAGLLVSVQAVLDEMREKGLWLSDDVYHTILVAAGESLVSP